MQIDNDDLVDRNSSLKISELEVDVNDIYRRLKTLENKRVGPPLGSIICLPIIPNDPSLKLLDGQCLALDGQYKKFCDYILGLISNDNSSVPVCTIAQYASEMSTYGQCGKFVINSTSSAVTSGAYSCDANSIKLPRIAKFIASGNVGGYALGEGQKDETKSHRHYSFVTDEGYHWSCYGGAIGSNSVNYKKLLGANSYEGWNTNSGEFYTSYAGGTETRPANIRYLYFITVL